jgi:signal transduction histidine kinase
VLSSLIDNAVKYSPDGGPIRITLARRGDEHAVSISDRGIGVPSAELASLGRPYFRTSNASIRNYPGLGLRLAVAREIVGRHGGRLWFESKLGEGTTAHLALPASDRISAGDRLPERAS